MNFNDAAFGGNLVEGNLLANLVRETVDHGPYNSWDRQPYIYKDPQGKVTNEPVMSSVRKNFLFCSYGGVKGIDHDDGSGFYADSENFMPYCSGKMKGQTQSLTGNVYLFPNWGPECVHMMGGMAAGVPMFYHNNTCVPSTSDIYSSCDPDPSLNRYSGNTYYLPSGVAQDGTIEGFPCECADAKHQKGAPCAKGNWSKWVSSGQDKGTKIIHGMPTTETMIGWGRDLLF